jgi:drug/metabolite transporter (DMT)-like permease
MMAGVLWSLVAALGFGFLQACNRKSNQLSDAYRTAFGLLLAVEVLLVLRAVVLGELGLLARLPLRVAVLFSVATFFHFAGGWTLLALSQQRIGVARTGALVSAAPLVGTLLAAPVLDEPLTLAILGGVLLAATGVALISLSGGRISGGGWARPWLALTVALIWGTSPVLIRIGLEDFPYPVLALTVGLGVAVPLYAVALAATGVGRGSRVPVAARRWMMLGGVSGAVAVSSQWISFTLTTIAIAITVQQLATLVVVALVPLMFKEPFERMNPLFFTGTAAMLAGSVLVVLAGR